MNGNEAGSIAVPGMWDNAGSVSGRLPAELQSGFVLSLIHPGGISILWEIRRGVCCPAGVVQVRAGHGWFVFWVISLRSILLSGVI